MIKQEFGLMQNNNRLRFRSGSRTHHQANYKLFTNIGNLIILQVRLLPGTVDIHIATW
jgi:hypothetical protein